MLNKTQKLKQTESLWRKHFTKKYRSIVLLLLYLPAFSFTMNAQKFSTPDGIYYKIINAGKKWVEVAPKNDASPFWDTDKPTGEITIPKTVSYTGNTYTVKNIGANAFEACAAITSVNIEADITEIGDWAFAGCTALKTLTFTDSLKAIKGRAFDNCENLKSLDIPASVTEIVIDEGVFANCTKLEALNVDANNSEYLSIEGVLFSKDTTKLLLYPANKDGENYNIPDSVSYIERYAFEKCPNLKVVVLPESINKLDRTLFYKCPVLKTIILPNTINIIDEFCTDSCAQLKELVCLVPDANDIAVDDWAFFNFDPTFGGTTAPKLYVPKGGLATYSGNEKWKLFSDKAEISVEIEHSKTIKVNEEFTLIPVTEPEDVKNLITYSSSDESIATVDKNGKVKATAKTGQVTIRALLGGVKADSCQVTVEQPIITVSVTLAGNITKIYDGTTKATLTPDNYKLTGITPGDDVSISNTEGTFADKNAGTGKSITVTGLILEGADKNKYTLSATEVSGSIGEITAKAITVTADSKTKIKGTNDPELSYTSEPQLFTGDEFTGKLKREEGEAPGDYAITQGDLSAGTNYAITFVGATFTITGNSTSIEDIQIAGLKLYPNPVESICTLETSNLGILKIYSLNGKQVRTIPITSNKQQVDLNNLQSGIYIAKINNKVIRLVKQ
ncbi:MAG: hypothetical protein CSB06_01735 [Bacteroidia bacterium]|nr:MAG: hypothetical protein CSB06_01735 [Bacteroidia bacterium]